MGIKEIMGLTDAEVAKPLPKPTKWSQPFWEGTKQGKLLLKKCADCGTIDHPPYLYCTNCMSENSQWIEASGKGTLYAYAINVFGVPFPFWDDMPYVVAMIDLEEGPRMISNVVECDHDKLKNGMQLEVVFEKINDDITLPKWRPVG